MQKEFRIFFMPIGKISSEYLSVSAAVLHRYSSPTLLLTPPDGQTTPPHPGLLSTPNLTRPSGIPITSTKLSWNATVVGSRLGARSWNGSELDRDELEIRLVGRERTISAMLERGVSIRWRGLERYRRAGER